MKLLKKNLRIGKSFPAPCSDKWMKSIIISAFVIRPLPPSKNYVGSIKEDWVYFYWRSCNRCYAEWYYDGNFYMPKCKTGKYILSFGQPNLPTCSMASTYLFFHLLSKPSLHLIAKMILGIITILFTTANFDWDFTCFKRVNNCYILLLNSPKTLENTGFIAGELSLIVSLVLYHPISVYELW